MPDFTKKVIKQRSEVLAPGETCLGATYAMPGGRFGRMLGFGVAGAVGTIVADQASRRRAEEHGEALGAGLAGRLTEGSDAVIAVTDRRLLFFAFKKMKGDPGDLVAEYTLDEVASIETERKKLSVALLITFADGSVADFDAQKMAKPDALVSGFSTATGR